MAIASLVIGIISLITCGGACIGALLALIFGIIALMRVKRDPATFGGKGLAIAGIVVSVVSAAGGSVVGAIAVPNMLKAQREAHETAAVSNLKTLQAGEKTYQLTKGKGAFGDLKELGDEGIIDSSLASGVKDGYRFEVRLFTSPDGKPMFDATAIPTSTGAFGTGKWSYGCNEDYFIFGTEGAVELRGTPSRRFPEGATLIP